MCSVGTWALVPSVNYKLAILNPGHLRHFTAFSSSSHPYSAFSSSSCIRLRNNPCHCFVLVPHHLRSRVLVSCVVLILVIVSVVVSLSVVPVSYQVESKHSFSQPSLLRRSQASCGILAEYLPETCSPSSYWSRTHHPPLQLQTGYPEPRLLATFQRAALVGSD